MEATLESILVSVPQAATIWMIMLLAVALAVAAMALPRRRAAAAGAAEPAEPPADDDTRFADEVAVAAERAAATARRRREQWQEAAAAVDAAWQAYEAADRAARRSAAACAFPTVRRRRDDADRERYLHRAATAACRRGELSIGQLNEVLAHRCGWDPRLDPPVQEARLRRVVLQRRLAEYRAASERERAAWQTAELASAALVSLRAEACVARIRAGGRPASADAQWWSEQWATTEPLPVPA